jgi:hypothetical protein
MLLLKIPNEAKFKYMLIISFLSIFSVLMLNNNLNQVKSNIITNNNNNRALKEPMGVVKHRVGFFLIGTGKYIQLTSKLIDSMENYFCTKKRTFDVYVHYFILTDDLKFTPNISRANLNRNFSIIYQKQLDWPMSTLLRFENILKNSNLINFASFDYLYWLDSDMKMVDYICEDIFGDLVGTQHPMFYKSSDSYPYESSNTKSKAFLEQHHRYENPYYVGSFYGGTGDEMHKLLTTCNESIQYDFQELNEFIAVWHDESHLNKYKFFFPY